MNSEPAATPHARSALVLVVVSAEAPGASAFGVAIVSAIWPVLPISFL
jgi:hypothetical protein